MVRVHRVFEEEDGLGETFQLREGVGSSEADMDVEACGGVECGCYADWGLAERGDGVVYGGEDPCPGGIFEDGGCDLEGGCGGGGGAGDGGVGFDLEDCGGVWWGGLEEEFLEVGGAGVEGVGEVGEGAAD